MSSLGESDAAGAASGPEGAGSDDADPPVGDLPLPPYPEGLGPPVLHAFRQMRDPIAFGEQAMGPRDVVRIRLVGMGHVYAVSHPETAKRMLLTERGRFAKSEDFRIAFGEGLLTVEGEEWARQRDVLQPLFTRDRVMSYADGMVEQVRRRTDRWADGQRLELQREMADMTLDVLFATVLGRELDLDGDAAIREAAADLHEWFLPTSYFLPNWVPTPARRRFRKAKSRLQAQADRLLAENDGADPGEAEDLLSLLVGLRDAGVTDTAMLTDERLRDQMVTIIFAGHDTTTTTLTFAFWALANHPDVRERFHAEVDALDGPPTMDDLEDLAVTERVVTETLRLFPPVYRLPRVTTEDVAVGGYRVPEGERVLLAQRLIQRDERFFDDPDAFRPSRWAGDGPDCHDFAYAPFGGGPRICIGREFALLEAKLALATVGRRFHLAWLDDDSREAAPLSPQMTLRMEPGREVRVTER